MKRSLEIREMKPSGTCLKKGGENEVKTKSLTPFARRAGLMIMLVFIFTAVGSVNACGFLGIFGQASWKEEVLLHDGSKIIVKRWQKRMNIYTLEKSTLLKEQSLSFKHPQTKKKIFWRNGPTEDIQTATLNLVALHINNGIPYIITDTYGCLAFNKWGRPNPPYVIFKYEDNAWKRIQLTELPLEFTNVNLVINTTGYDEEIAIGQGTVSAEKVKKLNSSLTQEIYKTIVRTPFKGEECPGRIYDGQGWSGVDYSKMRLSYEACIDECKKVLSDLKYCPCERLFNKSNTGE